MYNTSYQAASAVITGSEKYPDIRGLAVFVPTELGTMVSVSVYGLPKSEGECRCDVFAMHIHEGMTCTGNAEDPFADVKGHYNPNGCLHPCHKGDMPPLFADNGTAYFAFITTRFSLSAIFCGTKGVCAKLLVSAVSSTLMWNSTLGR